MTDILLTPLDLAPIFASHPRIETERLLLRTTTLADAEAVFDYAGDPEATTFMIFPRHQSIKESIDFIENNPRVFEKRESIGCAIEVKATGEVAGTCSFHHIAPEHHKLEIGYILRRSYWGRGYMTEVLRAMIRYAFDEMNMHRIEAVCDPRNERSWRVMERCGMIHEGTHIDSELRFGTFVSQRVYAIIRPANADRP